MRFRGRRSVTPLYQHAIHATRPTLGFVGIQLSVPCPIPFFECQAAFIAEEWARPAGERYGVPGYRVRGTGCRVRGTGCEVQGAGYGVVRGERYRVRGAG